MKTIKIITVSITILITITIVSSFTFCSATNKKHNAKLEEKKMMNMFVSHGHCVTPFTGEITNFTLDLSPQKDMGNPIEDMKLSFEINPNTFVVCAGDELTKRIKTPGLFINKANDNITFKTTQTYTMGIDWYQLNGTLSIKGVEHSVQFYISGIREANETWPSTLVLEGQINLKDWGIDYDKIVNNKSDQINTKWMHFNMKIPMKQWQNNYMFQYPESK